MNDDTVTENFVSAGGDNADGTSGTGDNNGANDLNGANWADGMNGANGADEVTTETTATTPTIQTIAAATPGDTIASETAGGLADTATGVNEPADMAASADASAGTDSDTGTTPFTATSPYASPYVSPTSAFDYFGDDSAGSEYQGNPGSEQSSTPEAARGNSAPTSRREERAEQRQRKAAWKQQQRAAKEYAKEAAHNGYPGAQNWSVPAGAPTTPGNDSDYDARWNRYGEKWESYGYAWNEDYRAWQRQQALHPVYRKGPNVAAIVWGGITLLVGVVAITWVWMPRLFDSTNIWAVILSVGFAVIGLSLVIGAIVTSISGMRHKKSESGSSDEDHYQAPPAQR